MCLIAKMEKKADLPRDVVSFAMKRNADGWGYMYADPETGRVVAKTGMGGENVFLDAFASVPDNVACAVHFRFSTRGAKDESNLHPFKVLDRVKHKQDVFLMHNGPQITRGCSGDKKRSDTREFCEDILHPLLLSRPRFLRTPTFRRVMEEMTTERVLMLEGCGKWHVFNAKSWEQRDGVLYSNTYSLPPTAEELARQAKWQSNQFKPGKTSSPHGTYYGGHYGSFWEDEDDGWEQLPGGAWVRKGTSAIPTTGGAKTTPSGVRVTRLDGAGRPIPEGQDRPSLCPNRNNALCRVGCKIGDTCIATPKAKTKRGMNVAKLPKNPTQKERDTWADRELAARIFKAGGTVESVPDVWTRDGLNGASETEVFNMVIGDASGCERFLKSEGAVFAPGVAARLPEVATDLVLDVLYTPRNLWAGDVIC